MTAQPTRAGRTPQQERSKRKVEDILDQAEAIIEAEGLGGLTMRKVAKGAGVGQATLYGYFPNIERLVSGVAERIAETVSRILAEVPEPRPDTPLHELSKHYLSAFQEIYEGERVAHHIFEAVLSGDDTIENEILILTGFVERFSKALKKSKPKVSEADAHRIALGYYRIADAFLWQHPLGSSEREPWRTLLRQTLASYLESALDDRAMKERCVNRSPPKAAAP